MSALVSLATAAVLSFGFTVGPQATECFHERADASDHMLGTWAVSSDDAHIDEWHVKVNSPSGAVVYSVEGDREGSFDYYTTSEGTYVLCFHNSHAGRSVDVTAKIHIGDPPDLIQLAKTEHLTPIEERIKNVRGRARDRVPPLLWALPLLMPPKLTPRRMTSCAAPQLHESMNAVRDLQDQMREQDELQSKMTQSTRSWLLYLTLIEAAVLFGTSLWQILYLKSFFEVKRVV
jgi:hypothetical protein